ncbi:MAG TPA: group 1 truncated hemoglobin [Pyrinomonadaceae bacterium]|nr:group 1 truncated hemoglobin [Pyrinomonadaceae bacterium]
MRKNFHRTLGLVVLLFVVGCGFEARAQESTAMPAQGGAQSLYKRLGGYDALAAVTDDFIGRLVADKSLGRFFGGASNDSKKRIRQLVVDQLCAATGGPCLYIGRDMKTTHTGLGITEDDWTASVKHLTDTLDKFKVPKAEKDELFKIVGTLKPDIVEKK